MGAVETKARRSTGASTARRLGVGGQRLSDEIRRWQARLQAVVACIGETRVEDVHDGRVAARRLRSLLKSFGPLFHAPWARCYRAELRDFARAFAAVREADVVAEILLVHARNATALSEADLRRLTLALEAMRNDARAGLRRRMVEPDWQSLAAGLATRAGEAPKLARERIGQRDLLQLTERSLRKAERMIGRNPRDADALHELRLKLKHCRYALGAAVPGKAAARLETRLRAAQEAIGQHRDAAAARAWVAGHEDMLGRRIAGRMAKLLEVEEARLYAESMKRAAKVPPACSRWRAENDTPIPT